MTILQVIAPCSAVFGVLWLLHLVVSDGKPSRLPFRVEYDLWAASTPRG